MKKSQAESQYGILGQREGRGDRNSGQVRNTEEESRAEHKQKGMGSGRTAGALGPKVSG